MSKTFKSLALACIAMFAGIMSYAQVTTSALSGKITDAKGTPLYRQFNPNVNLRDSLWCNYQFRRTLYHPGYA